MTRCLAVPLALLALLVPTSMAAAADPLVIGGSDVPDGAAPWMAAVIANPASDDWRGQFCGATLIDARFVLTAAHCVVFTLQLFGEQFEIVLPPSFVRVAIGRRDLRSPTGELRRVKSVRINPRYDGGELQNDVALIELARPVTASPLPMADAATVASEAPGAASTVYGYGELVASFDPDLGSTSRFLQQAPVQLADPSVCSATYPSTVPGVDGYDPATMICAAGSTTTPCFGDSGGPLVGQGAGGPHVIGIVSFGIRCGDPRTPMVYTRVSGVRAWIDAARLPDPALSRPSVRVTRRGVVSARATIDTHGRPVVWRIDALRTIVDEETGEKAVIRRSSPGRRLTTTDGVAAGVRETVGHLRAGRWEVRVFAVTEAGVAVAGKTRVVIVPRPS